MSKTKGGGSTRNGRDSHAKRLGVKALRRHRRHGRRDHRAPARHPLPPRRERRPGRRRHAVRHRRRQGEVRPAQAAASSSTSCPTDPPASSGGWCVNRLRRRSAHDPAPRRLIGRRASGRSTPRRRWSPGRRSSRSAWCNVHPRASTAVCRCSSGSMRRGPCWPAAVVLEPHHPLGPREIEPRDHLARPIAHDVLPGGVGRAQSARRRTSLASAGEPGRMASVQASRARLGAAGTPTPARRRLGSGHRRLDLGRCWSGPGPVPSRRRIRVQAG